MIYSFFHASNNLYILNLIAYMYLPITNFALDSPLIFVGFDFKSTRFGSLLRQSWFLKYQKCSDTTTEFDMKSCKLYVDEAGFAFIWFASSCLDAEVVLHLL